MATGQLYSVRGGNLSGHSADSYRVLNVPRCGLVFTDQVPHGAGVSSNSTGSISYDSDNMGGTTFITCQTPGVYICTAKTVWAGGGVANVWTRIIVNNNPALVVKTSTESRDASTWGIHLSLAGTWIAQKGDTISLYQFSNIAVNLTDQNLCATLISTLG